MENIGKIIIRVKGKKGNLELNPDNYDIRDIADILNIAENLILSSSKKNRPLISYEIENGSVKHILKTSLQVVIGFNAIISQIKATNSLVFLEPQTAKAFQFFELEAKKNNFEYEISTSVSEDLKLIINRQSKFITSEDIWVNTEFYFYGTIVDAGGKNQANIHLDTKEFGLLTINSNRTTLSNFENNFLYKKYGIRASGKQNLKSSEIDKNSLELLEIINYNPSFKPDYLNSLIEKAKKSWSDVSDVDQWLQKVRGYDA